MEAAVDREQALGVDMGVALGGGEVDMAEQLLDGAQVGAVLEEMGGEAVAQEVGIDAFADPGQRAGGMDQAPQRQAAEGPAARAQQQALLAAGGVEPRPQVAQVAPQAGPRSG